MQFKFFLAKATHNEYTNMFSTKDQGLEDLVDFTDLL